MFTAARYNPPFFQKHPFARVVPILGSELCERLAYYGIATNIIIYMTTVLNERNSSAAQNSSAWQGTVYLTPLIGAFVADQWWGRYWTIVWFSMIYVIGLAILSLSAGLPNMTPPSGQAATGGQLGFFWVGMYLIALGTGGIKPCVSTFGADQFDESDPEEAKLIPRFYNWFYAFVNIGAVVSATVIVYVQSDVSWTLGFAIPAGAFVVALLLFVSCSAFYRHKRTGQLPFKRWYCVVRGAIRHRKREIPEDRARLHEVEGPVSIVPGQFKMASTPNMACLDKAAVADAATPGAPDPYLVTVTEVEELKCFIRLLPVAAVLVVYNALYAQISTLFVLQGSAMDCRLGSWSIPPATLSVLDSLAVILWVFLYDLVVAPFFQRIGFPISRLTRIGVGILVALFSMAAAATVEAVRLRVVRDHGLTDVDPANNNSVPMSVFWQIPQYFLVGMSEVFAMIGGLEFFYSQSPEGMRSFASAIQLLCVSLGSYLASALVSIVSSVSTGGGAPGWVADNLNQGHLDYFFALLAVLGAITLCIYAVFVAPWYTYRTAIIPEETDGDEKKTDDVFDAADDKRAPPAQPTGAPLFRISSRASGQLALKRRSFVPAAHGYEMAAGDYEVQDIAPKTRTAATGEP
ncbi:proton-dependent oligopeptide transporter [Helicosporidium sp. ATCC 50920]|nr:proton-dependent oligopeptide transporter [Helicosporidium sp. ATCC 50920]|eukprot:KDD76324.1 proton-dependent oligopeptide transporter [Helicosporidium sp. ATCC 50920]